MTAIPLLAYENGISLQIIGYSFFAILLLYWLRTIFLTPKQNIPVGAELEEYNLSEVSEILILKILSYHPAWGG